MHSLLLSSYDKHVLCHKHRLAHLLKNFNKADPFYYNKKWKSGELFDLIENQNNEIAKGCIVYFDKN